MKLLAGAHSCEERNAITWGHMCTLPEKLLPVHAHAVSRVAAVNYS